MTAMGSWVLMPWVDFASYLILAVLVAGLVGLLVGYRIGVRAEQTPHIPADCRMYGAVDTRAQVEAAARRRALEELAARYPVAFTHLLDEALADAGVRGVPSPALSPHTPETSEGGHR